MSSTPIALAQQRADGLTRANEYRLRRACEKHAVRALPRVEGLAKVACLILAPPEWLLGYPVGELLIWPHGVGDWAAGKILTAATLTAAPLSPRKPVRELTERQRRLIASALTRERSPRELTGSAA